MDAISITREDRCSDRLEDESTGSHEDNTSPSFDRTILQQTRQKGRQLRRNRGMDEPSEILGFEHTQRKTKHAFWLVGEETLL